MKKEIIPLPQLQAAIQMTQERIRTLQEREIELQSGLDAVRSELIELTGENQLVPVPANHERRKTRRDNRRKQPSLAEVMRDILSNEGQPMSVRAVEAALRSRGYASRSKNLRSNISATVNQYADFHRPERGLVALRRNVTV